MTVTVTPYSGKSLGHNAELLQVGVECVGAIHRGGSLVPLLLWWHEEVEGKVKIWPRKLLGANKTSFGQLYAHCISIDLDGRALILSTAVNGKAELLSACCCRHKLHPCFSYIAIHSAHRHL